MRLTTASVLTASSLLLASHAIAQDEKNPTIDLGPKFVKGDTARYQVQSALSQSLQVEQNPPQTADFSSTIEVDLVIASVTEDAVRVRIELDEIAGSVIANGNILEFSSETDPAQDASPLAAGLRPLVGKSFVIVFNPDGTLKGAEGVERLFNGVPPQLVQTSAQVIGLAGLPRTVGNVFSLRQNAEPVPVGESWSESQRYDTGLGPLTINQTLTLASLTDQVATIDLDGDADFKPDPNVRNEESGGYVKEVDTEINGRIVWDPQKQRTKEYETLVSMRFLESGGKPGMRTREIKARSETVLRELPSEAQAPAEDAASENAADDDHSGD